MVAFEYKKKKDFQQSWLSTLIIIVNLIVNFITGWPACLKVCLFMIQIVTTDEYETNSGFMQYSRGVSNKKFKKKFSKWQWNYFDVQTTNISTNLDGNLGYLDGNKGNAVKELNFKKSILKSLRTLMKL